MSTVTCLQTGQPCSVEPNECTLPVFPDNCVKATLPAEGEIDPDGEELPPNGPPL